MPTSSTSIVPRSPGRKIAGTGSVAVLPAALLGDSAAVRQARAALEGAGAAPILLLADEGLDAAAVARYVHDRTRPAQPFVQVD